MTGGEDSQLSLCEKVVVIVGEQRCLLASNVRALRGGERGRKSWEAYLIHQYPF